MMAIASSVFAKVRLHARSITKSGDRKLSRQKTTQKPARSRNAFRCNALTIQRFSAPLGQYQMACSRMERAGKPRHRPQSPRGKGESAGSDRIKSFGVEI